MPPKKQKVDHNMRCVSCDGLLRYEKDRIKVVNSTDEAEEFSLLLAKPVNVTDAFCGQCRSSTARMKSKYREPEASSSTANEEFTVLENIPQTERDLNIPSLDLPSQMSQSSLTDSPQTDSQTSISTSESSQSTVDPSFNLRIRNVPAVDMVEMPFKRLMSSRKCCCVCFSKPNSLAIIPFKARMQVFVDSRIFVPKHNRCCTHHLINQRFYTDDLKKLKVYSPSSNIEKTELVLFLNVLSEKSVDSILNKAHDYDLSSERIQALTGYTPEQLKMLTTMLTSMRNSDNRSVNQALFVFLFKLRTGSSNSVIASIFDMKCEQQVSDYCESVLRSFKVDILPTHCGVQACSREDLILNHTSPYVKQLYGYEGQLVLIADGTYLRHQKSTNNYYQRKSYSEKSTVM